MTYKTIYTEVEVDVDLADFETEDLIEELDSRGHMVDSDSKELLEAVYEKRRLGQDYQHQLDQLIYSGLGKML
jgi:hypothetical protein